MKNTNPFNVPGTPIARLGQKSDARIKLVAAAVVVATVFLFSGLFIQGCQRQPSTNAANTDNPAGGTSTDANGTAMTSSTATTNTIAASTPDAGSSNVTSTATPATAATTSAPMSPAPGSPDTSTPPAPAAGTKDYVVVKGDSFYKIAKANHITMKALTEANPGTDSSKLKVGQTLHVPQAAESSTATAAATAPAASSAHTTTMALSTSDSGEKSYVVKSGDTLGRIAKAHGTTVKAIKVANGLTSDRIAVGKSLKLPQGKSAPASAA